MGIAVFDLATCQQPACFHKFVDDCGIGVSFFALSVQNRGTTKKWQVRAHRAVFHHVICDDLFKHPKITIKFKLFHAVGGGAMYKAGAFGIGYKIRCPKIADVIPFAV